MKRWIQRTLAGLFGVTLLVGGGLAACSHHRPKTDSERAEWRQRMVAKAAGKLDLDIAQRAKLDTLAQVMAAQRSQLMGTSDPRQDLMALVAGERLDRVKAQAWIDGKTSAMQGAAPPVLTAAADFFDSLRPEQQAKLREYLQRGGRHGWRG